MNRRIVCGLCIPLLGVLSACGSSPPTRYYTLDAAAAPAAATPGPWIRIDRVTIPGELDRPQLVQRIDANRLQISEGDRWAAPLDEAIQRVLTADLAARIQAPEGSGSGADVRTVSVDIQEFYGNARCEVTLRATWRLQQAVPSGARPKLAVIEVPSSGECPASLATTMSRALDRLSGQIVADLLSSASASR